MNLRNNLGDSYRKGDLDKKPNNQGSRAYKRFFEGYEEVTIPNRNGRGFRIKRIYRGGYYRQDITTCRWVLLKMIYAFLFILSFCFFANPALRSIPVNSVWYVTISQAVVVALYFWSVTVLCSYIVSGRNMTISKYKRACVPIRYAFKSTFIALLVTTVLTVLFVVVNPAKDTGRDTINMIQYLISALLIFIIYEVERRINYTVLEETDEEYSGEFNH